MRQVKVIGAVEGRPVAYVGNRKLYHGDIVDFDDFFRPDVKLPTWAQPVAKKERLEVTKGPGTPRDPFAVSQKSRTAQLAGANSGDATTVAEVAGLERGAKPPSSAEEVGAQLRAEQREKQAGESKRAQDADVLGEQ